MATPSESSSDVEGAAPLESNPLISTDSSKLVSRGSCVELSITPPTTWIRIEVLFSAKCPDNLLECCRLAPKGCYGFWNYTPSEPTGCLGATVSGTTLHRSRRVARVGVEFSMQDRGIELQNR